MPWGMQIESRELYIRYFGHLTPEDVKAATNLASSHSHLDEIRTVIVDLSEVTTHETSQRSTVEIAFIGKAIYRSIIEAAVKYAFVSTDEALVDLCQLYVEQFNGLYLVFGIFDDLDSARA